jgi:hypothetical protein
MYTNPSSAITISLEIQIKKVTISESLATAIPIVKILKYFMVSRMQPKQF